ncbi:MAG: O-antigen ligase family protein [Candidatus Hydrogenedentes bacterium]|nr:O-antigen ligase family protein [Candidatus Hydrogenedentota bacterium]
MSEYKYIIFLVGSIVCVPVGILLASLWRKFHDFVFMFLVFGTCMPSGLFGFPTDINFLSREWYRGTTRGVEVSYLDLLAIILLVSSVIVRSKEGRKIFWPPSLVLLLLYLFWCALNVGVMSDPKLFGLFELTKIARAILLFGAVAAYLRSPRELRVFIWALALTILYQAGICLRDRYLFHVHRVRGTLAHPNSLSMYCLQCVPIFIAAFLAKDTSKALRVACVLAYLGAAGCILLTISRTGFVALVLLSVASFGLCMGFRITPGRVGMALLGTVLIVLMMAKSWDTTMSRLGETHLQQEYLSEEGDRGSYFRQGAPAIADHPITGVGLNNWSWWISNRYGVEAGKNYEAYVSTSISPASLTATAAPAHNIYLLTVTELGWPGLFLFLAILFQWLWMSGKALLGEHDMLLGSFRVGAFLSLGGVILQSWTEWEFRQTPMFFLGHIIMAVSATLYFYCDKKATST